ncbi:flagellar basal body-associated FliL family protein [Aliarcobacter lanthieri]|uniref:flagellar basal body-associated FliL family protein n=1 Tax=Aliarcobacter lanthieri TaxID=1355374 RepID=UPI00047E5794|nr:flagellar basal body-associated FliL family protein [Aliarcobacter lanthieri]QKF58374.1 flagellar motor-associated protein FliL [Aliarcobacter lanthieri]
MADENEVVKKPSDGKGILIVLLVLVIVLIMVVAGGTYFLLDKISNSSSNSEQTKEELVTNNNSSSGAGVDAKFKADVNELVLNLTDSRGREKIMKLSFSIRSSDPTIEKIVQDYLAEITDVVITQVSSRSSEELLTVGGKNQLKDELISEINNIINYVTRTNSNVVSNILFTTFVIK